MRLLVGEALGESQAALDLPVMLQLLNVFRRGDDNGELCAPFGRLSHLPNRHAIRFGGKLAPVGRDLLVAGELIVVAEVEAEELFRGRQVPLSAGERGDGAGREGRQERGASEL